METKKIKTKTTKIDDELIDSLTLNPAQDNNKNKKTAEKPGISKTDELIDLLATSGPTAAGAKISSSRVGGSTFSNSSSTSSHSSIKSIGKSNIIFTIILFLFLIATIVILTISIIALFNQGYSLFGLKFHFLDNIF